MSAEMTTVVPMTSAAALSSHKIVSRHHERAAIVYVRQSTAQQLVRHQESTRLQYGLTERAAALGWTHDRVVVIDDDLGRSGASADGRPGFQRLVAEVGLDHVGIILGIEMSRLARSCRDWHQLLEVCAIFGTLIGDLDGIYDPANYNDRLLLGLKGTMSEAELHVLKQRMLQGKLAKARRGELGLSLPIGYVRRASGEVIQDPDEEARAVVARVFEQFEARGTVHGVLRYLVDHDVRIPVRASSGVNKGELEWHRPNRVTLTNMLHHPAYAGAYVYGRRPTDPRRKQPGRPSTGRTVAKMGQWLVCLHNRWPSYITWDQYERNIEQLGANRNRALSTVRRGPTLLSGLLVCGRCGARMAAQYSSGHARYSCAREAVDYAGKVCMSIRATSVDETVSALVLRALEPSALEVSLQVAANIEAERRRLDESWTLRRERAQYDVDRAMRQYNAVEPENRLVARTLERQFEDKLSAQRALEEEHHRFEAQQPTTLSAEERASIRALAENIPALWAAASTSSAERQTIVRQLVDQIDLHIEGTTEQAKVVIQWVGGHHTIASFVRPVARTDQLSYHRKLLDRIQQLRNEKLTSLQIAERLNTGGWRPPKRRSTFNAEMVRTIMSRNGMTLERTATRRAISRPKIKKDEWFLPDLAAELAMPVITLYTWVRREWVAARKLTTGRERDAWVIRANAQELARLRALRAAPKLGWRSEKWIASA
jgi:DNA invertase Pin-like site-specific DNA recombinase